MRAPQAGQPVIGHGQIAPIWLVHLRPSGSSEKIQTKIPQNSHGQFPSKPLLRYKIIYYKDLETLNAQLGGPWISHSDKKNKKFNFDVSQYIYLESSYFCSSDRLCSTII